MTKTINNVIFRTLLFMVFTLIFCVMGCGPSANDVEIERIKAETQRNMYSASNSNNLSPLRYYDVGEITIKRPDGGESKSTVIIIEVDSVKFIGWKNLNEGLQLLPLKK